MAGETMKPDTTHPRQCPICVKELANRTGLISHLNATDHLEKIIAEMRASRDEIDTLKDAVAAWRGLARERLAS
jgi:hypothetical protein